MLNAKIDELRSILLERASKADVARGYCAASIVSILIVVGTALILISEIGLGTVTPEEASIRLVLVAAVATLIVILLAVGRATIRLRRAAALGPELSTSSEAEALDRLTASFQQMFDLAHVSLFGLNKDGLIDEWSEAAEGLTGYRSSDVMGKAPIDTFIFEEDRQVAVEILESCLAGGSIAGVELRVVRRDQEVITTGVSVEARRTINGEVNGVAGVAQDLSHLKEMQTEQQRVADDLTALIDTANAPIFGIDASGRVNEWNQTAVRLTGFSKDEVMGRDLVADFITDEYKASVKGVLDKALVGEQTANYEFPLYTKDGNRVDVLLNSTSRRDAVGNIVGVVGVGQDITELREKDTALNQAQKMEAIGHLTGGIAHDFNNLLTIIGGNLQFLKDQIDDSSEDSVEFFEDAVSAVKDGAELTQRLLSFARVKPTKPVYIDLNDSVTGFCRFLQRSIGDNIHLDVQMPEDDIVIKSDAGQLENCLLNLSLNARDSMRDGGTLTINVEPVSLDDDVAAQIGVTNGESFVKISVRDTGVGIPEKIQDQVFDPFFTTKEMGRGSGLGLAMVYAFVKQSGGFCEIDSEEGVGTDVKMYLPMSKENATLAEGEAPSITAGFAGQTVVVVDDDARVRRIARQKFTKLGFQVEEAANAKEGRDLLENGVVPDLLFTDVIMPGGENGKELAKWVKQAYPSVAILITTGFTEDDFDKPGQNTQEEFVVVRKPYEDHELIDGIEAAYSEAINYKN